ncbi:MULTISPECIES: hypothetical protein [Pseudomonas]|uniref:hypothetical protein n=1 Tax=Pseudomonas TaxID=286 RepID=UPI002446DBAA|nr:MULTISPECIES: hypothetical protein [Pseudomonas]MDH1550623.1 hypothetical protein [Pseudomonas juntendi]
MTDTFNVHVESQMGKEYDLVDVEVEISFPAPTVYTGADGSGARIKRAGELRIRAGEFPGWYSAELIFVTNSKSGEERTYEITRHNTVPQVDGEWLAFPVMGRN